MKKQNQLFTNFSAGKVDERKLLNNIEQLINDVVPKNLLGMLATATMTHENTIKFFNKYILNPIDINNYEIYNLETKEYEYKNIALFLNAIHIIYSMHKGITFESTFKSKLIYDIDQEYSRCICNVNFFKYKLKKAKKDQYLIYSDKLADSRLRLVEIKSRLSNLINKRQNI